MPIVFGNTGNNDANAVTSQTLSFSMGVGGPDNAFPALIGAANIQGGAGQTVSSMTYGGIPMTFIIAANTGTTRARVELWGLTGPNLLLGTNNLVANFAASTDVVLGAASFFGVDQADPFRPSNSANGNGTTITLYIPSMNGGMIVSSACDGSTPSGPGANQTQLWVNSTPTNISSIASRSTTSSSDAGNSDTYSIDVNDDWVCCGCTIKPSPRRRV